MRRSLVGALAGLTVMATAACPREQPPECAAALECLYPGGETRPDVEANFFIRNRYAQCAEDPYLENEDGELVNRDVTLRVLGENGECWAWGASDTYYQACRQSCLNVLRDDCFHSRANPMQRYCEAFMIAAIDQTCETLPSYKPDGDAGVAFDTEIEEIGCTFERDLDAPDGGA